MDKIRKIVFVTDLTLWSMGNKRGGPAFTKTIEYYNKDYEVFLVSDEQANVGYPLLDPTHNIVLKKSCFYKYGQIRFIGFVFRIIDHTIMTNRMYKAVNALAKDQKIDLLYAYEVFGVKACSKLSKRNHMPFVTRFQGTILSQYPNSFIFRLRLYPHFQALREKSDLVIMTDDGTQGNKVLDLLGNDTKRLFVRNGLDLMRPEVLDQITDKDAFIVRKKYNIGDDEIMFLTVSRLVGWKKVDRAIKGFNDYIQCGGNGKLVIVGDGDDKLELESIVDGYNLKSKVIFTGAVEHDDVYLYMKAADVFLSLYDLSNVGNPLLEAMVLGKAIVTLDVGDTNKIIKNRENGILLTYDLLGSLGNVMLELGNIPSLRIKLGKAAQEYAMENFKTWSERMSIEYQTISKLLSSNRGG